MGQHQYHVWFIDVFPAGYWRAVKHVTFFEGIFINGNEQGMYMLLFAAGVTKTKIDEFDVVSLISLSTFATDIYIVSSNGLWISSLSLFITYHFFFGLATKKNKDEQISFWIKIKTAEAPF